MVLNSRHKEMLEFEDLFWSRGGSLNKNKEIEERFHLTPVRYYQLLNVIVDQPEAKEYRPLLVKRIDRMKASRRRGRIKDRTAPKSAIKNQPEQKPHLYLVK